MAEYKILVVEDDATLNSVLSYNLKKEGYSTFAVFDGLQALQAARKEKPDLVILDLMLPGMDGLEVCRTLRKDQIMPILMLTAKTEEIDKIVGLEVGADDYMTKPFSMRELMARVRAMLRRSEMVKQEVIKNEASESPVIQAGDIEINPSHHTVRNRENPVDLNPKEFDLLVFLARHKGQVFSRELLLEKVWGYDYAGDTRTVDVHIRWLRQKLEANPELPRYLITVRGVGYKFEVAR
jgi:two-component system, OmpR family, response regulator